MDGRGPVRRIRLRSPQVGPGQAELATPVLRLRRTRLRTQQRLKAKVGWSLSTPSHLGLFQFCYGFPLVPFGTGQLASVLLWSWRLPLFSPPPSSMFGHGGAPPTHGNVA